MLLSVLFFALGATYAKPACPGQCLCSCVQLRSGMLLSKLFSALGAEPACPVIAFAFVSNCAQACFSACSSLPLVQNQPAQVNAQLTFLENAINSSKADYIIISQHQPIFGELFYP